VKVETDRAAASPSAQHTHFDSAALNALNPQDRYNLLIGGIIPRPIALVTAVDPLGRANAAPFCFFSCLSADPPVIVIGAENRAGARFKGAGHAIRLTEEFTVNLVDGAMLEAMNACAVQFPSGVDELAKAGLRAIAGADVGCPRIAEAPASLECKRYMSLEVGKSREIVLGLVLGCFIRGQRKMDAVRRLGGYSRSRDPFDLPAMTFEERRSGQAGANAKPAR
jgi:flavin reductase (DIM6/NTAB) family NADH-FMN oxidoreductase RutF